MREQVVIYSTCAACGQAFRVGHQLRVCDACLLDERDRLEAGLLAAVYAGDRATVQALAADLDQADTAATGLLDAATAYARQGWPVLPLLPRDKRPASRHGLHDATTDEARVARWWQRHPDHNIGLATGRLFDVIDIDTNTEHSDAGEWWVRAKDVPDFETDGLALTPRGLHIYVRPTGAGNKAKLGGISGIDYRGLGGYVVAAPSVRDDGTYQWVTEPSPRIKQ